ncbi:MAG: M48 family metalloprotease [Deltaproteobacteria bacterium]|nr:M48 family metalloprotease [Deltaproteobacteria bacterium]
MTQLLIFETHREQSAIARRSTVYREPHLEQHLERMLVRLMPTKAPEGTIPRVVLISDHGLNAYSFPDGAIYIHTGLLSHLENEAELALLLAHELAHVTGRHALRVLAAIPADTDVTVFDRALSDSMSWFHDMVAPKELAYPSERLSSLRRSLEQEADRVGLDMVIKAIYDPYEALEIFGHLREGDGKGTGADRAAALLEALTPIDSAPGRLTDRRSFGKHLQQLLLDQARLELRQGRWHEALRCARRLVRDAPSHASGYFLLGEILRQRNEAGDTPQALSHYFQAVVFDPSLPGPHKAIGLIYLEQGQARLAKSFFENALALAPHSHDNEYIRSYLTQCIIKIEGEDL